jgi:hypothetical protein
VLSSVDDISMDEVGYGRQGEHEKRFILFGLHSRGAAAVNPTVAARSLVMAAAVSSTKANKSGVYMSEVSMIIYLCRFGNVVLACRMCVAKSTPGLSRELHFVLNRLTIGPKCGRVTAYTWRMRKKMYFGPLFGLLPNSGGLQFDLPRRQSS